MASNHGDRSFFSRLERLIRSRILGFPFVVTALLTRWEVYGKENLFSALKRRKDLSRGLITVSNHISLFDDPLVMVGLLKLYNFTVETKVWWSTACSANFNPQGKGFTSRFVRYFSDVSNMIFLSRAKKRGDAPPLVLDEPASYIESKFDQNSIEVISKKASHRGMNLNSYLKSFYTGVSEGEIKGKHAPLNQIGVIETIARVNSGGWVHLFPEGGRSRGMHLRSPRAGIGKVLYHAEDCDILPICFYGTEKVLPVGSFFPQFFKRVVVNIGQPISPGQLMEFKGLENSVEVYNGISRFIMEKIAELRPLVLEKYLGEEKAAEILFEEAQIAKALSHSGSDKQPSHPDLFIPTGFGSPVSASCQPFQ